MQRLCCGRSEPWKREGRSGNIEVGGSEGLFREHPKGYQPPGKLARFVDMTLWVVFYPLVFVIKKMEGIE